MMTLALTVTPADAALAVADPELSDAGAQLYAGQCHDHYVRAQDEADRLGAVVAAVEAALFRRLGVQP